ncbi:hypothetical protein [Desulfitobacterium hafniense]|nr:hypothetical protein [Desulfitobacterium hafniense]
MIDFTSCKVNKFIAYGGANGNKINIFYGNTRPSLSLYLMA